MPIQRVALAFCASWIVWHTATVADSNEQKMKILIEAGLARTTSIVGSAETFAACLRVRDGLIAEWSRGGTGGAVRERAGIETGIVTFRKDDQSAGLRVERDIFACLPATIDLRVSLPSGGRK